MKIKMKKIVLCLSLVIALALSAPAFATDASKDPDAKTKREMIKKSIANYKGDCPCPYSQKGGRYCRGKSAYSMPWAPNPPMCYFRDISPEMVEAYKAEKKQQKTAVKKKPKAPQSVPKPKSG